MTTWIATTQDNKLADRTSDIESTNATTAADLQLDGNEYQALRGFGGCFNELGWLPETKFADGIKKTIDWYLDNREWWETIISGEYQHYYAKMYGNR